MSLTAWILLGLISLIAGFLGNKGGTGPVFGFLYHAVTGQRAT